MEDKIVIRDKQDKTRLSYWFPLVAAAGIPVPRTTIISLSDDEATGLAMHLFGEGPADELHRLRAKIVGAADVLGVPFFLRTDFTSAKHDWAKSCCVTNPDLIPHHIHAIWEYSECADMLGLPCDVWVVREMLKTEPLFHAFWGNMPITREFRFFVRDGKIEHAQNYWPPDAIIDPSREDWRDRLSAASVLAKDERTELERLTLKANAVVPGYWSVDWLWTDRGFVLCDMAEGDCSFKWGAKP